MKHTQKPSQKHQKVQLDLTSQPQEALTDEQLHRVFPKPTAIRDLTDADLEDVQGGAVNAYRPLEDKASPKLGIHPDPTAVE